jgi:Domain of unknown function (DUF1996)
MRRGLLAVVLAVAALGAAPERSADPWRPRPDAELGSFRVECDLAQQRRIDPIVSWGEVSSHLHDFFGNETVVATSTYDSLRAGSSNCTAEEDRSAYWAPTLMSDDGDRVEPEVGVFYYRNRPVDYRETVEFPPGLRMVAGGTFPRAYWTCDGESDAAPESRKRSIPDCGDDGEIKLHVFFPSCWDGKNLDSSDHRRHVVYGVDGDGRPADIDAERCPSTHPVKIPELDLRVQYDVEDGRDYRLSDGRVIPHADFFNAWTQSDLERFVHRCLGRVGKSCGLIDDE